MAIAIVGDIHGRLTEMYQRLDTIEKQRNLKIDCVFQVGDFKALRDERDLRYYRGPKIYHSLGDFPHFFKIGRVPKKTFFIGGNHDNDHWHSEHPEGQQVLENLFYLGRSGVSQIEDFKFAWVSGNYSPVDIDKTSPRRYHHFTRKDLEKLHGAENIDFLLLHDCPSFSDISSRVGLEILSKPEFQQGLKRNFGNTPLYEIIEQLKPQFSFSGHIHHNFDINIYLDDGNTRLVILDELGNPGSIYILNSNQSLYSVE